MTVAGGQRGCIRAVEEAMDKHRVKTFVDHVFLDMAGVMVAGMGYPGVKTGLFRTMTGKGGARAPLAKR